MPNKKTKNSKVHKKETSHKVKKVNKVVIDKNKDKDDILGPDSLIKKIPIIEISEEVLEIDAPEEDVDAETLEEGMLEADINPFGDRYEV